jgi:pimeloyl-ACP methyl ester carboxylesterase
MIQATAVTTDGVSIHHESTGEGADVILIHGLTDSSHTWGPIVDMLAATYRVTTLDLRGHGRSGDSDDYQAVGMARDVAAVVGSLGITAPLVIGHSLGGIVATAYASSAPTRAVINVDQTLALGAFQEGLQQVEALLRDPGSFPEIVAAIFGSMDGDVLSDATKADIAAHRRPSQAVVLGVWNEVLTAPIPEIEAMMRDVTSTITAPYLSLQFVDGADTYGQWLRALLPQAVVEQWPGLGHYGHRIHPERFVERVIEFDN